ncbi:uncharacterized protein PHACADRAFT_160454 [Phanerochaete carnosa HHB-10118-sp]|uniref:non-specific serine/threonine protein kinase n=1 Tax=Phanerochaete carnosa (strain HHB-10118-sp) TaxID=650164 RepID=K5WD28_PHACS|nr:uncharacterized protein PHACADRAFT_160454 [Phanerochaete carnosa HHB-10118-sp]EKM56909.1 hypothetical protein PHACADRAFT_160454 [Phanerochaete carnosa HHB-10118-sp]
MECRIVDDGRIQLLDCIGAGTFGAVYRARDLAEPSASLLAVKIIPRRGPLYQVCSRELQYHQDVHEHPHVVTLRHSFVDDDFLYLVEEYCPGGDMWKAIKMNRLFWRRDELVTRVFLQVIDAVSWCHQRGVYHRDLKPGNILISPDGQDIWLTDFGLASRKESSCTFHIGTPQYRSPECNDICGEHQPYNLERNDIWAVGVILVNMLTGTTPWKGATGANDYYQSYLHSKEFLRSTLPISKEAAYICQRIFTENEEDSIGLAELRDLVCEVKEWWMDEEEIAQSSEHLQNVASDIRRPDELLFMSCDDSDFSSSSEDEFNSLEDDSDDSDEHSNGMRSTSLLAVEEGRVHIWTEVEKLANVPLNGTPSSSSSSLPTPDAPRIEPVAQAAGTKPSARPGSSSNSSSSYYTTSGSSSVASSWPVAQGGFGVKKTLTRSSGFGVRRHIKRLFSVAA